MPAHFVVLDSTPVIQRGMEIGSPSLAFFLFFFHQAQAWHCRDGGMEGERRRGERKDVVLVKFGRLHVFSWVMPQVQAKAELFFFV